MVRIGGLSFDTVDYDARSDVLYLSVGPPRPAAETVPTPEGHAVRYDANDRVIGVTLISPRAKMVRRRGVPITIGDKHLVAEAEGVEAAMAARVTRGRSARL
jgi:uncharacterized protein YuzE